MVTGEQVKAARTLLGWSIEELADQAALSAKTLEAFEEGRMLLVKMHKAVLREVLEGAGVFFSEGRAATLKALRR
jgi:transcriptional regulator with XRE-family HTH domain